MHVIRIKREKKIGSDKVRTSRSSERGTVFFIPFIKQTIFMGYLYSMLYIEMGTCTFAANRTVECDDTEKCIIIIIIIKDV